jgi:transcription termination factor Rho
MRIVDLVAPMGKGTRGLIVSPSKAGKTRLLEEITNERPEEVTYFRRAVEAEIFASSSDQELHEHLELTEMTLAHVRVDLECGRDVVVLVDSLGPVPWRFPVVSSGWHVISREAAPSPSSPRLLWIPALEWIN